MHERPWYANPWLIILALVVFFPGGLVLMWWQRPWRTRTMGIVTAVVAILFIVAVASDGEPESGAGDDGTDTVQAQETSEGAEPELTQVPTQPPEPTATLEPSPTPRPMNEALLAPGESATAEGIRITILEFINPYIPASAYLKPAAGHRFVAFKLLFENVSNHNQYVGAFDLKLKDRDGYEYRPGFAEPEPSLYDMPFELTGGGKFEGWVSFEVRELALLAELMYDPNIFTKEDHHFRAP